VPCLQGLEAAPAAWQLCSHRSGHAG
jgi:hypothetical protein